MSGYPVPDPHYAYKLGVIRDALARNYDPSPIFDPMQDALVRRVARRLPVDLIADVVELIKLARKSP